HARGGGGGGRRLPGRALHRHDRGVVRADPDRLAAGYLGDPRPVRRRAGGGPRGAGPGQSAQTAQASISIMRSGMASAETWTAVLAGGRAGSTYSSRIARTTRSIALSVH